LLRENTKIKTLKKCVFIPNSTSYTTQHPTSKIPDSKYKILKNT